MTSAAIRRSALVLLSACVAAGPSRAQKPAPLERVLLPGCATPLAGRWMSREDARSGVPLGGMGTGFLELRADARLHDTVTANNWMAPAPLPGVALRFASGVGRSTRSTLLIGSAAASEQPARVRYFGHYPMADLDYGRPLPGVPVEVWVRAHGTVVPNDYTLSNLPVVFFTLRLTNRGERPAPVEVSLDWPSYASDERTAEGDAAGYLGWRRPRLRPGEKWTLGVTQQLGSQATAVPAANFHRLGPPGLASLVSECTLAGSVLAKAGWRISLDRYGGLHRHQPPSALEGSERISPAWLFWLEWNGRRTGLPRTVAAHSVQRGLRLASPTRTNRTRDRAYSVLETDDGALRLTVITELEEQAVTRWFLLENRSKREVRSPALVSAVRASLVAASMNGTIARVRPAAAIGRDSAAAIAFAQSAAGDPLVLRDRSQERSTHTGVGEWDALTRRLESGDWKSARPRSDRASFKPFQVNGYAGVQASDAASRRTVAIAGGGADWRAEAGPASYEEGLTLRVRGAVPPGQTKNVTLAVAWHAPTWKSGEGQLCLNRYAARWLNAMACLREALPRSAEIEQRIIAWQEAIARKRMPDWLAEALINSLYPLTRSTLWLDDGRFFHLEASDGRPATEAIVSRFYGSFSLLMLYPELETATLKRLAALQAGSGQIPSALGVSLRLNSPDWVSQKPIATSLFVLLCWRAIAWTKDDSLLRVLYPAVKSALEYLDRLDSDDDGLIDEAPSSEGGIPSNHAFEVWPWYGTSAYTAGLGLAARRAGEAMARQMGDADFAERCAAALTRGGASFEEKLWNGAHYRLFNDFEHGRMSETSLVNQLAGQWFAWLCGLGDIQPFDHALSALRSVARRNASATPYGAVNGALPDGRPDESGTTHSRDIVLAEVWNWATAALFAARRAGDSRLEADAMAAAEAAWAAVAASASMWNQRFNYSSSDGRPIAGSHCYGNMSLWALPFALDNATMLR